MSEKKNRQKKHDSILIVALLALAAALGGGYYFFHREPAMRAEVTIDGKLAEIMGKLRQDDILRRSRFMAPIMG